MLTVGLLNGRLNRFDWNRTLNGLPITLGVLELGCTHVNSLSCTIHLLCQNSARYD